MINLGRTKRQIVGENAFF